MVLPLREIIYNDDKQTLSDKRLAILDKVFSSFNPVQKNKDIEDFLKNKAVSFEQNRITSTFLVVNDEQLKKDKFVLDGFFSLSISLLCLKDDTAEDDKKKIRNQQQSSKGTNFPMYLIGQLARDVRTKKGFGKEELLTAISYIKVAQDRVGGSLVCIDCKNELIDYYSTFGFKFLQKNKKKDANGDKLNRMYAVI